MSLASGWKIAIIGCSLTLGGMAVSLAGDPRVAVPATEEITLLDPHVSADGKPTPIVVTGTDGKPHIDIPPTVIVHNFYYTGDRDFRGPRLEGGPSIVVVSHPETGERLYLDVIMLPGSPRVIYHKDKIEYEFGHDRICIHFFYSKLTGNSKATVKYVDGKDKPLRGSNPGKNKPSSPLSNALANTNLAIHKTSQVIVAPVINVVQATPLGSLFQDPSADIATQTRDFANQQAAIANEQAQQTIPTNR
ncbi:hypothetical protein GC163_01225 [bacterium]|nr:hypothetical protein [bacterium]